jgi:hypothetical protein
MITQSYEVVVPAAEPITTDAFWAFAPSPIATLSVYVAVIAAPVPATHLRVAMLFSAVFVKVTVPPRVRVPEIVSGPDGVMVIAAGATLAAAVNLP